MPYLVEGFLVIQENRCSTLPLICVINQFVYETCKLDSGGKSLPKK